VSRFVGLLGLISLFIARHDLDVDLDVDLASFCYFFNLILPNRSG
jgi:hypothetical protein